MMRRKRERIFEENRLLCTELDAQKDSLGTTAKGNVTVPTMAIATGCMVPACVSQDAMGGFVI